jgi:uncharacterized protein YndB with AHSA1/START domain
MPRARHVALEGDEGQTMAAQLLTLEHAPVVKTAMLIRRPVAEVFEAIVNPEVTTHFWFTRSSGRLEPGAQVQWDWEMYGASAQVRVLEIEPDRRILLEWGGDGSYTTVDWHFTALDTSSTFVEVENTGFGGSADAIVAEALDCMGGFSFTLAGLKAYLEHGIELRLVHDRFPTGLE